jgi:hypothetical protein
MPPGKRSAQDFSAHFGAAGLNSLVEWNTQREMGTKIAELRVGRGGVGCLVACVALRRPNPNAC